MTGTMTIGGLKRSERLVQINLSAASGPPIVSLMGALARCRVNLSFMTLAATGKGFSAAMGVAWERWSDVAPLLEDSGAAVDTVSPAGTITVFPHRRRSVLLEAALTAFGTAGVPVYAVASSLSALTFSTDYGQLDAAVSAIRAVAAVPDNHAPFIQPFRIEQQ